MSWPTFFPENCPPQDSTPATGTFYRVVLDRAGRALKTKHFWSQKRSQLNKTTWPPGICQCQLCGVSILQTMDDSLKLARILVDGIPANRQSVAQIAQGTLEEHMGRIKHTPDLKFGLQSHHDWWMPEDCDPTTAFQYCEVTVDKS